MAEEFGVDPPRLREHAHSTRDAKKLAVELARQLAGWTQRRVGQRYGAITSQTVGHIAKHLRNNARAKPLQDTAKRLKKGLLAKGK